MPATNVSRRHDFATTSPLYPPHHQSCHQSEREGVHKKDWDKYQHVLCHLPQMQVGTIAVKFPMPYHHRAISPKAKLSKHVTTLFLHPHEHLMLHVLHLPTPECAVAI